MQEQVKLVWDFKGPDAEHFAKHHEVHLKQFVLAEKIQDTQSSYEKVNEMHWFAGLIVNKSDMIAVRDALKPHRGLKV